jgi:hypothetical protein
VTAILVPLGFFWSIVAAIKLIADYRTRSKLIERGALEEVRALLSSPSGAARAASLKGRLGAAGVGLGLVIVQWAGLDRGDPVTAGAVLLFAGGALLVHYAPAPHLAGRRSSASSPPPATRRSRDGGYPCGRSGRMTTSETR